MPRPVIWFARLFGRFARDARGSVVIESLVAVLILSLGASAFFTFWDAYQSKYRTQKAAYTITDLISRQRGASLSRPFLDGMAQTATFLMRSDRSAALRVSQVRRIAGQATDTTGLVVDWSYSPCGKSALLQTATVGSVRNKLPLIDLGSALILVELEVAYDARMPSIGFGKITHRAYLSSLPRFEQQFLLTGTGATACR